MHDLLIPVKKTRTLPGRFVWPERVTLSSARDADAVPLEMLRAHLKAHVGCRTRVVWTAAEGAMVRCVRDPKIGGAEGYRLVVGQDGVEILAATDAGVYYGVQTLRELITVHGKTLPACRIDDAPDFKRRALYYDCARGKVPEVDTLKQLIERLASWKLNELQLYIKNTFVWKQHPKLSRGFSPFSPDDILEIQAHCKLHHVRFVPSMATVSHNELALQLPEYRHLAELPGYHGWEGGTMLCPSDPKSLKFVESLYSEFVPLFEAEDFNICCDEPWELGKGRSKRTADRIGSGRLYFDLLKKIHKLCGKHGKRMNAWADIVLKYPELIPELPSDMVMLNWDYAAECKRMARTKEIADAGLPVLVCPGTSCWQRHGTDMPNAISNVAGAAATGRKYGVEGMLNTDWGDFGHRNPLGVSLHGYAHGAAHAWHGRGVDDRTFTKTFARHVFGDKGRLGESLQALGGVAAQTHSYSTTLYHALVEPLKPPLPRFLKHFRRVPIVSHYPDQFPNAIERADRDALEQAVATLDVARFWPAEAKGLDRFAQLALADCRMAGHMDVLAARRALLGQALRQGRAAPGSVLQAWADAMQALAGEFETLWLTRNRPSRLADNLKLMALAEADARDCAG